MVDLRLRYDLGTLKIFSLAATLTLLAPSGVDALLHRPTVRRFLLAMFNSGLAFFLCSFQVRTATSGGGTDCGVVAGRGEQHFVLTFRAVPFETNASFL